MKTAQKHYQKILVIRRDNIGDLLCTTPLFSALRQHYPDAHIAVLANSYNAPILDHNPDLNRVYAYTKAKHASGSKLTAWWKEWRLFRELKKQSFDLIIHANPSIHARTAKLVRYLKAGDALGVATDKHSYNLNIQPQQLRGTHHVEQVFSLLQALDINASPGPLILKPSSNYQANSPTCVAIHLSSRKPDNRWSEQHYHELITQLVAQGLHVNLFWAPGSQNDPMHPGDDELAARIQAGFNHGVTSVSTHTLAELVNELNRCDLAICPDGGTMHIAAALQKPMVALFGCTDAQAWGPWNPQSIVLHGTGHADNIRVAQVVEALNQLRSQAA